MSTPTYMTAKRAGYVLAMIDVAKDFPEGAFWGFMAEKGIDVDEVIEVTDAPPYTPDSSGPADPSAPGGEP